MRPPLDPVVRGSSASGVHSSARLGHQTVVMRVTAARRRDGLLDRQVRATEAARRRYYAWLIDEVMRKAAMLKGKE